jgi:hypothetical protein
MKKLVFLTAAVLIAAAHPAAAHTIWIEPQGERLVVRFAEPGSEFETSPGFLDSLTAPSAFTMVTNRPNAAESRKESDSFALPGVGLTNVTCVETTFTVRSGRKPIFYARWQPANAGPARPALTFDLVPTANAGEVRVYFRGKPLGGATATLRPPAGKESHITADADGLLRFSAKDPGQYLLTIPHYREPLAGFHLGVAYSETSHNCALVWRQPP